MAFRTERDSMGEVEIPEDRYWGAQTERARRNFEISPFRIHPLALEALSAVKQVAARVNNDLGLLAPNLAMAIDQAAQEVREGHFPDDFPLDVFQTGSGTSWNMNMNEVLAGRANEILGYGRGGRYPVHPNDHVNLGQSSNDVIPTVLHLALCRATQALVEALDRLAQALEEKASTFSGYLKIGRTHLQDAVPMTLGQEVGAWAAQVHRAATAVASHLPALSQLAIGATALGTGLNTHLEFGERVCRELSRMFALDLRRAPNPFEAVSARDTLVGWAGSLAQSATALMKVAGDLRLLASGPRVGFGEIYLPPLQPGSSIMPGKVNPVIPEMVIQVGAYVLGTQTTVAVANQFATLQLNVMLPLLIHQTITSTEILTRSVRALDELCVRGLNADEERLKVGVEWSLAMVTPLAQVLGYDRAAQIAHRAVREKRTVREVCMEEKVLEPAELEHLLDPKNMLGSGGSSCNPG